MDFSITTERGFTQRAVSECAVERESQGIRLLAEAATSYWSLSKAFVVSVVISRHVKLGEKLKRSLEILFLHSKLKQPSRPIPDGWVEVTRPCEL